MRSPGPGTLAEARGSARPGSGPAALRRRAPDRRRRPSIWILAAVLLAAACAKEQPPPGVHPDNSPPRVREVRPADGSVVPGYEGDLEIRFDEPIERPRGLARELSSSPAFRYQVSFGFSEIRIRPEGGWREDVVYHFRLPEGVSDLLNNQRAEPLEVTFSTGPPITATRVEGRIVDRVQRQPVQGARVLFLARAGDSIPYSVVTDTSGAFALRALPPGSYRALGFRDQNGNRDLDRRLEPWDSVTFELSDSTAEAELELSLLEPDTTPPRLGSAEGRDSVLVALTFDDHLEPDQRFASTDVVVTDTAGAGVPVDSVGLTRASVGLEPVGEGEAGREPGDVPDRPDEPAGEAATAGDTAPTSAPGPADSAASRADTVPLPSRTVLVRTGRPLQDSVRYRVRAEGFLNLRGLAGGGEAEFLFTAPRDTLDGEGAADSAATRSDSAAAADSLPPSTASDTAPPSSADTAGGGGARAGPFPGGRP